MLDLILQQGLFASFFAFGIGGILSLALGSRRTEDKAFLIATIAVVALAASIYGIAYQKQFLGIYRLGSFGFFYNVFLGSMLAVVVANNGNLFLIAWEGMAAASYFLVIFERKEKQN